MGIPLTNITVKNTKNYIRVISEVIESKEFVLGKKVKGFEDAFADYIGTNYCLGVASGTDALLIALKALGISQRDEVIVPAFTFVASATPLLMLGATPVFVDVRKDLPLIDEEQVERAITKRTKAIIIVHLYGYPCNVTKLKKIAKEKNIYLIEDASQAHGTMYGDKKVGTFGDVAVFSFYPSKNLGAFGDGGAIVTSDKILFERMALLRNHGQDKKYTYKIMGYNSRLDSIQAAVLLLKLKELNSEVKKRSLLMKQYTSLLHDIPVTFFSEEKATLPAYHLFVIRLKERNSLYDYLNKKGIFCGIHYPKALPDESIFASTPGKFPNSRGYASTVLSLPFFSTLTRKQQLFIRDSLKAFFKKNK